MDILSMRGSVSLAVCRVSGAALRRLLTLLVCAAPSLGSLANEAEISPNSDTYSQRITILFTDEQSARDAKIAIEPLFDGHHRAVSCRWDDNWTSDNQKTRDIMEEYGVRGTWYLNGRDFHPGGKPADYLPVARELLKGGNSIGGHSLTHPYLTYFHSNRMFAETSGVRVEWEAALDQPVISYAYSFVDLRPLPEGRAVLERSLNTLARAGFYHLAEFINFFEDVKTPIELSPIMPPENSPYIAFRQAVEWGYGNKSITTHSPMISNSMHAWYGTERLDYGYCELRKRLELLAGLKNVWHCNQNEYAAYRRQYRKTRIKETRRSDRILEVNFVNRPRLIDLNCATPITIKISSVERNTVEDIQCSDAMVVASARVSDDGIRYHLMHSTKQALPRKIGHIPNASNATEIDQSSCDLDYPRIKGVLHAGNDTLTLTVVNDDLQPLENVRVAWRLPVGWENQRTQSMSSQGAGATKFSCPLVKLGGNELRFGAQPFAVQLDFRQGEEQGRIHFTCQRQGDSPDASWPLGNFSVLGPIPNDQFDTNDMVEIVETSGCPETWPSSNGSELLWRADARNGYVVQEWINPEYVRTMGTWDHVADTYVLRTKVTSAENREVRVVVSQDDTTVVLINGKRLEANLGHLNAGENEVVVLYPGRVITNMHARLAACFFRIEDPDTKQRVTDLKYEAF